jgi:ABC-type Fe3+-hydroxamate transport system substrate-binding protein
MLEMQAAYQQVAATRSHLVGRVLVPIWRDPWMAVGGDTYANDLLQLCGAYNVATELSGRYPRFELEQIGQLHPDIILLPSEPYAFAEADLPMLRSVFAGPCVFVDGELLTWYGPRIPLALQTFAAITSF